MILEGDCVEAMAAMDEASVDAIVTDPPYGLEFMGKEWDKLTQHKGGGWSPGNRRDFGSKVSNPTCRNCGGLFYLKAEGSAGHTKCRCDKPDFPNYRLRDSRRSQEWHQAWATEALRILKPGGHLLAFGGTRTYHRLACAVEDAGFEIRDSVIWIYGSGFPKSLDVSKAIDKRGGQPHLAGEIAEVIKTAREARGWTTGQADEHFCGGSTNWTWYEGRKGICRPPTPADFTRIAEEWPELAPLAEKVAEAERETVGTNDNVERAARIVEANGGGEIGFGAGSLNSDLTAPATPEALKWQGWGTALKPAHEPIVVARKPLAGTVAANVLEHGTGALNVDGCRVGTEPAFLQRPGTRSSGGLLNYTNQPHRVTSGGAGRWPANVTLSHLPECERVGARRVKGSAPASGPTLSATESVAHGDYYGARGAVPAYQDETIPSYDCAPGCPVAELDRQSGERPGATSNSHRARADSERSDACYGDYATTELSLGYGDTGGASRFFYCAKASRGERNAGLDGFEEREAPDFDGRPSGDFAERMNRERPPVMKQNVHPTVKPIDLMRWLVRLVTPPGGTVLDPFTGSGTTGVAATLEGVDFIGCELDPEYAEIAKARIEWWSQFPPGTSIEGALGIEAVDRVHRESGQIGLFG